MAEEAGGMFDHMMWLNRDLLPVYERIVELARADERKECEQLAAYLYSEARADEIEFAIRARGRS